MLRDNQALAVMLFSNNLSLTFFNHLLYDFFSEVVDWGYQDKQGATKVITWLALKGLEKEVVAEKTWLPICPFKFR
jgi:hypothetical protein